ncbi:MAG: hypothetical protein KAI59_04940 [Planctomycetes bacterium]|nr:hypothetical protein [Planctomycetota bacterium]
MESRINSFFVVCTIVLISICFAGGAIGQQEPAISAEVNEVSQAALPSFPYIAEITADNVNCRSGAGTNYYQCGKLNKLAKVQVVGSQFGWSRIVPQQGAFSWISKQYVSIDPNDSNIGVVTGDDVRVYAGSETIKPIHSTTLQGKLNKNNKVKLLGTEEGGYYKIAPPSFAYLWISTQYTKPLGEVGQVEMEVEPKIDETPTVVESDISVDAKILNAYYALEKKMKLERVKPLAEQNYDEIKKGLTSIANNKNAGRAAKYAKFALAQVERCQLALTVTDQIKIQDEQLEKTKKQIEKANLIRLSEVKEMGKFAAIGQFHISSVYTPQNELKHYLLTDETGKIICYALPQGDALEVDLNKFTNTQVGLIGTIEPHPQTAGALVRFTEIVELETAEKTE